VVIFNLKLPKYFNIYNFDVIVAKLGHIKLFDWLMWTCIGNMCLKYAATIDTAAYTGNLDSMKHMIEKYGSNIIRHTSSEAAKGEYILIIKWLIEEGHELNRNIPNILAKK
jgi:hypothetical protein